MKVKYSKDVDILMLELSGDPIAFAEKKGNIIINFYFVVSYPRNFMVTFISWCNKYFYTEFLFKKNYFFKF